MILLVHDEPFDAELKRKIKRLKGKDTEFLIDKEHSELRQKILGLKRSLKEKK